MEEGTIIFLLLLMLAIAMAAYSLRDFNRLCLATKLFGFQKKWFGLLRKGIYKGRMVEILLPVGIQVYFNDYSKPNLNYKEYFCLTEKNLFKKEGVIAKQLSVELKSNLKNFIIKYSKYNSVVKLCAYNRSIFFSKKHGIIIFHLPGKIFENPNSSKEALDIAVEAAKEMEKIGNRTSK